MSVGHASVGRRSTAISAHGGAAGVVGSLHMALVHDRGAGVFVSPEAMVITARTQGGWANPNLYISSIIYVFMIFVWKRATVGVSGGAGAAASGRTTGSECAALRVCGAAGAEASRHVGIRGERLFFPHRSRSRGYPSRGAAASETHTPPCCSGTSNEASGLAIRVSRPPARGHGGRSPVTVPWHSDGRRRQSKRKFFPL